MSEIVRSVCRRRPAHLAVLKPARLARRRRPAYPAEPQLVEAPRSDAGRTRWRWSLDLGAPLTETTAAPLPVWGWSASAAGPMPFVKFCSRMRAGEGNGASPVWGRPASTAGVFHEDGLLESEGRREERYLPSLGATGIHHANPTAIESRNDVDSGCTIIVSCA